MNNDQFKRSGLTAAIMTPFFMGMAPIFGKLAMRAGVDPYTLAALRTCLAALVLWIVYWIGFRRYTYIFPAGLVGAAAVGAVNGLGSLLYYNGLLLLDDASLAQLLSMLYVIFAMLLTRFYGHHVSRMSLFRAGLALVAVYLLVGVGGVVHGAIQWAGVGLMIGGGFMYALHVVLSQRVMYEMPAPTMTLYALTSMGITVFLARLIFGGVLLGLGWMPISPRAWVFVAGLTLVTGLSRVTLFAGVRNLGGMQTVLLNVSELAVTLLVAFFWLGERMTPVQWGGVTVLLVSVILSRWDSGMPDEVYRPVPPMPRRLGLTIPLDEKTLADLEKRAEREARRQEHRQRQSSATADSPEQH